MHAIQSNCCSQKVSISLLLSYAPLPQQPSAEPHNKARDAKERQIVSGRLFQTEVAAPEKALPPPGRQWWLEMTRGVDDEDQSGAVCRHQRLARQVLGC